MCKTFDGAAPLPAMSLRHSIEPPMRHIHTKFSKHPCNAFLDRRLTARLHVSRTFLMSLAHCAAFASSPSALAHGNYTLFMPSHITFSCPAFNAVLR